MGLRFDFLWLIVILLVGVSLAGCQNVCAIRDPEFAQLEHQVAPAWHDAEPARAVLAPAAADLDGPQSVATLVELALLQNPEIHAKRKQIESFAMRVPQAASLQDPMLNVTIPLSQVQTAAGQQDLVLSASQKVTWRGKRDVAAAKAEAAVDVAGAELFAVELEIIEQVKHACFDLEFLDETIQLANEDRQRLLKIRQSVQDRFQKDDAIQVDVLRVQQEVLDLDAELLQLDQQRKTAQAKLARLLHVSPDTAISVEREERAKSVPADLQRLYEQAIATRPELHAQLAEIHRDRQNAVLARLNHLPDPTVSATWIATASAGLSPIANGEDAFLIGVGINLPVYGKRLDAQIREAEATAVASARKYDSLLDRTQEQVKDLFERAHYQQELLDLLETDTLNTAERTRRLSIPAYEVDKIDIQQLLVAWRKLLRVEITKRRVEAELLKAIASLERVVGGELDSPEAAETLPAPGTGEPEDAPLPAPEP